MPTTASVKNYDVSHVHQGPGDLWILPAAPVDSAAPVVVLDTTSGTPDATTYPLAVHLGHAESATTIVVTPKMDDIKSDQSDGPIARYLTSLDMAIECTLEQLDPKIMQNVAPYAVFSTQVSPGWNLLTFGGQTLPAGICVAFIAPKRAAAGKFVVSCLFSAHGTVALSTAIGRAKPTTYKAEFKGLSDLTRTAGRQIGVIFETL